MMIILHEVDGTNFIIGFLDEVALSLFASLKKKNIKKKTGKRKSIEKHTNHDHDDGVASAKATAPVST